MQPATNSTVLGDFNNANFSNNGITSTFFRRARKFMVRTDGPDGLLIHYKSSTHLAFTRCSSTSSKCKADACRRWGSRGTAAHRSVEAGAGSLFILAEKITWRDSRHWTAIDQTWNFMCADCH